MLKQTSMQLAIAAAAVFSAQTALADSGSGHPIDYRYVEADLEIFSSEDQSFFGPRIEGRLAFHENIHAFAGMRLLSDDFDYNSFWVGAAWHQAYDAKTSLWVGGSLENQELRVETGFGEITADETGLGIQGGARHQYNEKMELAASARLVLGDLDYFSLGGKVRYAIAPQLDAVGGLELQDGDPVFLGGVSYSF